MAEQHSLSISVVWRGSLSLRKCFNFSRASEVESSKGGLKPCDSMSSSRSLYFLADSFCSWSRSASRRTISSSRASLRTSSAASKLAAFSKISADASTLVWRRKSSCLSNVFRHSLSASRMSSVAASSFVRNSARSSKTVCLSWSSTGREWSRGEEALAKSERPSSSRVSDFGTVRVLGRLGLGDSLCLSAKIDATIA